MVETDVESHQSPPPQDVVRAEILSSPPWVPQTRVRFREEASTSDELNAKRSFNISFLGIDNWVNKPPEGVELRHGVYEEEKLVRLPHEVCSKFFPKAALPTPFEPKWDVSTKESLDHVHPYNGGTLGLQMLKGGLFPADREYVASNDLHSPFAKACHEMEKAN